MPSLLKTLRLLSKQEDQVRAKAAGNVSAFVRAAVDAFIAAGGAIETVRAIGARTDDKTSQRNLRISVAPELWAHWARYAKAKGNHNVPSLIASALGAIFAPAPALPSVTAADVTEGRANGYRDFLAALQIGQTIELTRADLPTTLRKARINIFSTAEVLRVNVPGLRISTRITPRVLYVTRVA